MSISKVSIFVDIPCDRLQEIRLVHALSEAGTTIIIPSNLISRFRLLYEKLGMEYKVGSKGDIALSQHIRISHAEPVTEFCNLEKPLVFPKSMANKCFEMWNEDRKYRFSFAGLITGSRSNLIREWALKNFKLDLPDPTTSTKHWWAPILPARIRHYIPNQKIKIEKRVGDLTLWSSNSGRLFPGKTWDEEYFKLLSNSQFVLCPKGDCVWSYRFFESILCGSIPIVEDDCSIMEGFSYYSFSDEAKSLLWCREKAINNFNHLVKNFTFTVAEVKRVVENLI